MRSLRAPWILAALAAFAPAAGPAAAQQVPATQPMTIDAFLGLKALSDPQISPDGRLVAFTVTSPSLEPDRNVSRIHLLELSSGDTWEASGGAGVERSPRWSPDGKTLSFISTRGGSPQVWSLPIRGGEPAQLTHAVNGVTDFSWSPNGRAVYYVADVKWPVNQELDRRMGEYPSDARLFTDLLYRHWDRWRTGLRQHVFRQELGDTLATDITQMDRDVPTLALGGRDLAFSQFGTELAVTYNADPDVATSTNNNIYVMGPDGSSPQPITTNRANDHSPLYSPDSRYIAYLATEVPGAESDRQQIMLYERATGQRIALSQNWDRSVSAMTWMPDSRSLFAEVPENGERVIYRIEVPGGRRARVIAGGSNTSVRVTPRGSQLVFLRQSASRPAELYTAGPDGSGLRPLTGINERALAKLALSPLEPFRFVGALGDSVSGWLLKPPGFDSTRTYPLVYLIHGGPQGAWFDEWHPRWNYALFASRGYLVAAVNFHGSIGYGQKFTNSVSQHWGDYPYEDLMKGLDELVQRPYVDRRRVGAAGGSYGGYMVYWIAGQTNRFRTLVAHAGVFNPLSMMGTTDELWFPAYEFGGTQLASGARAVVEKWSPTNYIQNWSTPMLVIHGQRDYRVDVSEGLQAFTTLRLRGVPSKFLYFPDEGHWILGPRNRRLWWDTVLDWFDTTLKGGS